MYYNNAYGVACFRKKDELELLLVRKKYTYAFHKILKGHFNFNNLKSVKKILEKTSAYEKTILITYNYNMYWYHMYGSELDENRFGVYKKRFYKIVPEDKKRAFIELVRSTKKNHNIWEIPKGQLAESEKMINCAVREVEEETGLLCNSYRILSPYYRTYTKTIVNKSTKYIYNMNYYIAMLTNEENGNNVSGNYEETLEAKWYKLKDLHLLLENDIELYHFCKKLFKELKQSNIYGSFIQPSTKHYSC